MEYNFFEIRHFANRAGFEEIFPDFQTVKSDDFMVRGGKFYAILDKKSQMWRTDEFYVQEYVDESLREFERDFIEKSPEMRGKTIVRTLRGFKNKTWKEYRDYASSQPDHYVQLDDKVCFSDMDIKAKDYISKKLDYPLKEGPHEAWDKIVGTLYAPEERRKIEWAIGSVISGESKNIHKFIVLYGDPGAGKGTILNIIQDLFPGYYEVFDAKTLSSNSNNFAFEQFRTNPLIAIQMDGDLSKIEDNTKLNSLISHETVVMNEKRKQSYNFKPRCFLFMASNKPVQITDGRSGIMRRLIDVSPTGITIPTREYDRLMGQIHFERSGIAWHCLNVFRTLGKNAYNGYKPFDMIEKTNPFYNFVLDRYDFLFLERPEGICASEAYQEWVKYCGATGLQFPGPQYKFKEELKTYFNEYTELKRLSTSEVVRGWFSGGPNKDKIDDGTNGNHVIMHNEPTLGLVLDQTASLLDDMLKDCQAQYGEEKSEGGSKPSVAWSYCKTTLKDIDTSRLHFVRPPKNHIVIDFDLKNEKGEKDQLKNLEVADRWPKTYAEFSQGGNGVHLHYIYDGNVDELASTYADDIEIKVFTGKSSLRRRLTRCNNIPVAVLDNWILPKKEVKDTVDFDSVKSEEHIRNIIKKCLKKNIEQKHTTPAMSLIKKTLDDAYAAGIKYDVRDMRPAIQSFAAKSHHQKQFCMKMANELHYCSKDIAETTPSTKVMACKVEFSADKKEPEDTDKVTVTAKDIQMLELTAKALPKIHGIETKPIPKYSSEELVFFDIEVFPNLLLVNWKEAGEGKGMVRWINPTRSQINELFHKKLVGFNCRRYDNHVLYGRYIGYDNDAIFRLSSRIIGNSPNALFGNAYDISYTDVYDFAAKKQSLKKWEIELGIHHQELGLPWDQPVPEKLWPEVAKYCDNDVIATEAVFNHLAGDFKAREILADIAGMKVNDTTNQLTTRIIFGDDSKPQSQFNYPDLTKEFPGYRFEHGKSFYRHRIQIPPKEDFKMHRDVLKDMYGDRFVWFNDKERWVEVDEEIGEGGRVYAVPGIHKDVITFDVASMHPSSIIAENGFGKYTERFKQLLDIRIAIKHKDYDKAKKMLDGKLAKYLNDPEQADALSQALKIAINSVYGLTAAGFDNKFRDPRNKDNWVAKRGALFIETLRLKVIEMGGYVVHIKTDSIKVVRPTEKIKKFIMDYGKQWGYNFEVEDIYDKMCLVNDAVYIALRNKEDPGWLKECRKAKKKAEETGKPYVEPTRWSATGAQFAHPYVFKTLFSHRPIEFRDLCETKTVTSALYLDFNENLSDVSAYEKDLDKAVKRAKVLLKVEDLAGSWEEYPAWRKEHPDAVDQKTGTIYEELDEIVKDVDVLKEMIAQGHKYQFVGKAGSFCPVRPGTGGGILCRESNGKFSAATGSKGYRWREGESLEGADRMDLIDMAYFEGLATAARESVDGYARKIGSSFEEFASEDDIPKKLPGSGEPEGKEQAPSFVSIDEVLDRSDKAFGKEPVYEAPPFDEESIRKMEDELRDKVEGSKPSKVMIR